MYKLRKKLLENKMTLIASLPENKYELAKIAWESGADAIKVHCNVAHHASGNHFDSLEAFRGEFERIIADSPVPVGLVPGGSAEAAESVLDEVIGMGFDFISLYAHHTPAGFYRDLPINNFLSVNATYTFAEIDALLNGGYADMLELSIIDQSLYGTRLNARDLSAYKKIAGMSDVPCVMPTQKMIEPGDVPILHDTGIKAIMIGAVVYGKNGENMEATLKKFREAIDRL
jgi:hypothetical protein